MFFLYHVCVDLLRIYVAPLSFALNELHVIKHCLRRDGLRVSLVFMAIYRATVQKISFSQLDELTKKESENILFDLHNIVIYL